MNRFPRLLAAILSLGKNDRERAKNYGVGLRTIGRYRSDEWPEQYERIVQDLLFVDAFCADARALHQTPPADPQPPA